MGSYTPLACYTPLALLHPRPSPVSPIIIAAEGGATEARLFHRASLTSSVAPPSPPQVHLSEEEIADSDVVRSHVHDLAKLGEMKWRYRVVDEGHSPREEAIKVPVEAL